MFKRLFGNRDFYKKALLIMIPILIQQLLTSLVNLADNIMIGKISEDAVAGVNIAGQFVYIYFFGQLGGLGGASIYTSQFNGSNNQEGVKKCFRFKVIFSLIFFIIAFILFHTLGEPIFRIAFDNDEVNEEIAIMEGLTYLKVVSFSLLFYGLDQVLTTTLRELGHTKTPMIAGAIAIIVNIVFNYILMFGKFGLPALGVRGAAIATIISRIVEFAILLGVCLHRKYDYIINFFKDFNIGEDLFKQILKKGWPLFLNELLWCSANTIVTLLYAYEGKTAVAALGIANTVINILFVVFAAMGTGIAVLVGNELGANHLQEAQDNAKKLQVFMVLICVCTGSMMAIFGRYIPNIYEVSDVTKNYAATFILIGSCFMPIYAYNVSCFHILRSGGKSVLTMVFDSCFQWILVLPLTFILTRTTTLNVIYIYLFVQCCEFIKTIIGTCLVKSRIWVKNLTALRN